MLNGLPEMRTETRTETRTEIRMNYDLCSESQCLLLFRNTHKRDLGSGGFMKRRAILIPPE